MGTGGGTSGAAQRRVIFLFIVCLPLVTSRLSESPPPCPPVNSCPNHLTAGCTPSSDVPSPPHDGGDLDLVPDMIGDQELRSATLAEAVVLALLTARKDEGTELETFFILVFSSALFALAFSEIPLRNLFPRFAQIVMTILVNVVVALRLPMKFLWVPAVCFGISLATLIVCL